MAPNSFAENKIGAGEIRKQEEKQFYQSSWYLVEVEHQRTGRRNSEGTTDNRYGIVHLGELIDKDYHSIQVYRKVRFTWNYAILHGSIVLVSNSRNEVEDKLAELSAGNQAALVREKPEMAYIVQFMRGTTTIVHKIVYEQEILWPKDPQGLDKSSEVVFRDSGNINRLGKVLEIGASYKELQNPIAMIEAESVGKISGEKAAAEEDKSGESEQSFYLMQYSTGPLDLVYCIVSQQSVGVEESKGMGIKVQFLHQDRIQQGTIILKASGRDKLIERLNTLKMVDRNSLSCSDLTNDDCDYSLVAIFSTSTVSSCYPYSWTPLLKL